MTETAIFYLIIDALLIAYACYSWYWQANIELRGTYRSSSIIWALIFIWIGFMWNYLEKGDQSLNFFLALFLLTSIIDGFAGFAPKRIVVSGYFKRTIRYSEVVHCNFDRNARDEKRKRNLSGDDKEKPAVLYPLLSGREQDCFRLKEVCQT